MSGETSEFWGNYRKECQMQFLNDSLLSYWYLLKVCNIVYIKLKYFLIKFKVNLKYQSLTQRIFRIEFKVPKNVQSFSKLLTIFGSN